MERERPERGEFAIVLRRLREAASLTQEELAERAGLTPNAIGALERGERRRPYPHTVRALLEALHADDDGRVALIEAAQAAPLRRRKESDAAVPGPSAGVATAPLIGREAELAQLLDLLLDGASQLVTVTGPGGVGKTRLASAAATRFAAERGEDAAVAELALLTDPALVLPAAARALGAHQGEPGAMLDRLAEALRERPRLLVLDNLEHLTAASAQLAELLGRCPTLTILATSRAPLRIRAEQEFPLGPLALPRGGDLASIQAAPAVRMFVERARAVAPGFILDDASAPPVEAICRRLDGLPLALELAAAHARLLGAHALLARLDQAIARPRSRDLPARQTTMRATLDWSHELLTAQEQMLLRRLSVFVGPFTLEAAELVAGPDVDTFAALAGLVEQSLVMPLDDDPGYRMLEPVRQYAMGHLSVCGEVAEVAGRHAAYYGELARAARRGLHGADQAGWLDRLQSEHGNLRAALAADLDAGAAVSAGRLLADTWLYWALRGVAAEGIAWAERVFAATPEDIGPVTLALAGLRYASGNSAGTRSAGGSAARAFEAAGDRESLAEALVLFGSGSALVGDFAAAADDLARAVTLSRSIGDEWSLAHALIARGLLHLGADEPAEGLAALDAAETVARALASPFTLATLLNVQASLALLAGDDETALDLLDEAAQLAAAVGTTWTLVYTLPDLGVVAARRGSFELAAVFFSAADSVATASSLAVAFGPDQRAADAGLLTTREHLDDSAFERAWARGRDVQAADVPALVAEIRQSAQVPRTRAT